MIKKSFQDAVDIIKKGGVIVAPTDTIYGILADALNPDAVEKVYKLKKRDTKKPFIILIPSLEYLEYFGIKPKKTEKKLLEARGITVVLDIPNREDLKYLHRDTKSIAFRIPDYQELIDFMEKVGRPLIAPSANPEGMPPAKDIDEAFSYFGDNVDLYIDKGKITNTKPSTIVKINSDLKVIREGRHTKKDIEKIINKN